MALTRSQTLTDYVYNLANIERINPSPHLHTIPASGHCISDSDSAWLADYAAVRAVGAVLEPTGAPPHRVTSVSGFPTKPLIDIIITNSNAADEDAYPQRLEAVGIYMRSQESA